MKKTVISLLVLALTHSVSAQNNNVTELRRNWFDFQIVQHIGLNSWSKESYVDDGFPATALTELRIAYNFYSFIPHCGFFADMSAGIMPAPKMKSFSLDRIPMPNSGTQYYLREMLSEQGSGKTSAHFKMTGGIFGKIPAGEKLSILPYFGAGFITMPHRKYEMILKEQGSNMQYQATYIWNRPPNYNDEYDNNIPLGYLVARLNIKHKLSEKSNLTLGLEYTWFLDSLDFYGKYSNTFNANIEREFSVKGNKMNMLGISVGISFM